MGVSITGRGLEEPRPAALPHPVPLGYHRPMKRHRRGRLRRYWFVELWAWLFGRERSRR